MSRKNFFPALLAALLLAGCGKSQKELAAEAAAADKAQAEAAAAAEAAKKAAGPTDQEKRRAAEVFVGLVCGSPRLLDDAETNLDLTEAFAGEGADAAEAENQARKNRAYYTALLQRELPARGASYEALEKFAPGVLPPHQDAEGTKFYRTMILTGCRGLDPDHAERVLGGILAYGAVPASR